MAVLRKYGAHKPSLLLAMLCLTLCRPVQSEDVPPSEAPFKRGLNAQPSSMQMAASLPPGTLRNLDFLPRVQTSRPPSRPRKFLGRRNLKVRNDREQKYVQLLLVCVGFISMLIVILALRSLPPVKKTT